VRDAHVRLATLDRADPAGTRGRRWPVRVEPFHLGHFDAVGPVGVEFLRKLAYGLHTRQVTCVTFYTEGFSRLTPCATAPIATGRSDSGRVGFAPTRRRCLCTAHRQFDPKRPEPHMKFVNWTLRTPPWRSRRRHVSHIPLDHQTNAVFICTVSFPQCSRGIESL
jgi:hypothetical protein